MMTTFQVPSLARSVVLGQRSVDTEVTADNIRRFGKRSIGRRIVSCRLTTMGTLVPMQLTRKRVRLDLTIGSGCAACGLTASVPSEVSMHDLIRPPQEWVAANAEKIRELGLKTPHTPVLLKFFAVKILRCSVMDKPHKLLLIASKILAAGNRKVMQRETRVGSSSGILVRSAGNEFSN